MPRVDFLPFLIITTFLLNFTQMKNSDHPDVHVRSELSGIPRQNAQNEGGHCVWPPQPISSYFSHSYWDYPVCNKHDQLPMPLRGHRVKGIQQDRVPEVTSSTMPLEEGSGEQHLPDVDYAEKDFMKIIEKPEETPIPSTEAPPTTATETPEEDVNKSRVEDTIPSFSEWTKLQLAQRQETIINNINKNKTLQHQEGKNFASPVCGAKIRNNNPEAQNPSGIISSSNDEYMLNRCTSTIWFILELCEPLQIEKVGLGNLELFASNPHEIDLEISARYPSREWHLLGTFHAPDIRNVHSLILPQSSNSTFGKFLRVSIRSHHGSEHYCPLSLIRVYGKSEYEVLESESASGADADDHGADYDGTSVFEEELNFNNKPVTKSVFGAAKEAVVDMVKKAVNILGNGNKSSNSTTPEQDMMGNMSHCMSLIQCVDETNSSFHEAVVMTLACKSHLLSWMAKYMQWCGWDNCHTYFNAYSIGTPRMPEGFLSALYGPGILESLCHFLHPLKSCKSIPATMSGNKTAATEDRLLELATGVPNTTLQPNSPEQIDENKDSDNKYGDVKDANANGNGHSNGNGNGAKKDETPANLDKKPDSPAESTAPISKPANGASASASQDPIPPQVLEQPQAENIWHKQAPKPDQKQKDENSPPVPDPVPTPSSFIIIEPPASQQMPSPAEGEQFAGAFQQNKESVFVRLSNRIKALEINQSLSSGYLEELSRRFKKQNEDINHSHELFRNLLNESMRRTKWLEASFRYEIRKLTRNIENLREVIYKVEVQRSGLVIFGLCQLICTVLVFWKQATHTCCCKRPDTSSNAVDTKASSNQNSTSNSYQNHEFVFRKRSNSEQYLKKVSKKKRRRDMLRGNDDVFAFKAPIIQPSLNGLGSAHASVNSSNTLPKSSSSSVIGGTNRIYPVPHANNPSASGGSSSIKKESAHESQNCQRTSNDMNDVRTTGSNSQSGSATSLDKIKAGKSKSSKAFAFWK